MKPNNISGKASERKLDEKCAAKKKAKKKKRLLVAVRVLMNAETLRDFLKESETRNLSQSNTALSKMGYPLNRVGRPKMQTDPAKSPADYNGEI